jgi:hypothetical protein
MDSVRQNGAASRAILAGMEIRHGGDRLDSGQSGDVLELKRALPSSRIWMRRRHGPARGRPSWEKCSFQKPSGDENRRHAQHSLRWLKRAMSQAARLTHAPLCDALDGAARHQRHRAFSLMIAQHRRLIGQTHNGEMEKLQVRRAGWRRSRNPPSRNVHRRVTPIGPRFARTDGLQPALRTGCIDPNQWECVAVVPRRRRSG